MKYPIKRSKQMQDIERAEKKTRDLRRQAERREKLSQQFLSFKAYDLEEEKDGEKGGTAWQ